VQREYGFFICTNIFFSSVNPDRPPEAPADILNNLLDQRVDPRKLVENKATDDPQHENEPVVAQV
jgi:hypothetical protein